MNALCIRIQEERNYETFIALSRELCHLIECKEVRFRHAGAREWQRNRPWKTVPAVVKKVLKSLHPGQPDKVEILIETADELFREVRIENTLAGIDGRPVALKNGDRVDVTFEGATAQR